MSVRVFEFHGGVISGVSLERLVVGVCRVLKIYATVSQTQDQEVHNVRVLYPFISPFTTCSQLLRSDLSVPSSVIQHSRASSASFGTAVTERDRFVVADVAGSGVTEPLAREDSRVIVA